MIIFIDIIILAFIAYFTISKSLQSDPLTEISKLLSIIIAILGAVFLYPEILQNLILGLTSYFFDLNKSQIDSNFFNMIAFFMQFFIIYIIALTIINYFKKFIAIKTKSMIGKISIIFPSIIRALLIVVIMIYSLESFPYYMIDSESKLQESVTYKALSKFSNIIIK